MANPPPVVVIEKKRGMGCCGIGCIILLVIALLLAITAGVIGWSAYRGINNLTTATPTTLPVFDGGDELYQSATKKLNDFSQAAQHRQGPTSLHLNANEINTLIARNTELKSNNIQLFVAITGDMAEVRASFPLKLLALQAFQDRYAEGDATFGFDFDHLTKNFNLRIKKIVVARQEIPPSYFPAIEQQFGTSLNQMLQNDSQAREAIDQAKTISIKNSELVIELE